MLAVVEESREETIRYSPVVLPLLVPPLAVTLLGMVMRVPPVLDATHVGA
jgi:hypothetical protein